jgi:hypothetical protein
MRLDAVGKVCLVQLMVHGFEVKVMATGLQGARALWLLSWMRDEVLMTLDVGSQDALSRTIWVVNVGNERLPDSLWSLEKHAVEAEMIAATRPPF